MNLRQKLMLRQLNKAGIRPLSGRAPSLLFLHTDQGVIVTDDPKILAKQTKICKVNELLKQAEAATHDSEAVIKLTTEAIKQCAEVKESNPLQISALTMRAFTYLQMGKYTEMLADTERALTLGPQDHSVLFLSGFAFYHLKDYKNAEKNILRGMQLEPKDAKPHTELSKLIISTFINAEKKLHPTLFTEEELPSNELLYLQARKSMLAGKFQEAADRLTQAANQDPFNPQIRNDLALAHFGLEKTSKVSSVNSNLIYSAWVLRTDFGFKEHPDNCFKFLDLWSRMCWFRALGALVTGDLESADNAFDQLVKNLKRISAQEKDHASTNSLNKRVLTEIKTDITAAINSGEYTRILPQLPLYFSFVNYHNYGGAFVDLVIETCVTIFKLEKEFYSKFGFPVSEMKKVEKKETVVESVAVSELKNTDNKDRRKKHKNQEQKAQRKKALNKLNKDKATQQARAASSSSVELATEVKPIKKVQEEIKPELQVLPEESKELLLDTLNSPKKSALKAKARKARKKERLKQSRLKVEASASQNRACVSESKVESKLELKTEFKSEVKKPATSSDQAITFSLGQAKSYKKMFIGLNKFRRNIKILIRPDTADCVRLLDEFAPTTVTGSEVRNALMKNNEPLKDSDIVTAASESEVYKALEHKYIVNKTPKPGVLKIEKIIKTGAEIPMEVYCSPHFPYIDKDFAHRDITLNTFHARVSKKENVGYVYATDQAILDLENKQIRLVQAQDLSTTESQVNEYVLLLRVINFSTRWPDYQLPPDFIRRATEVTAALAWCGMYPVTPNQFGQVNSTLKKLLNGNSSNVKENFIKLISFGFLAHLYPAITSEIIYLDNEFMLSEKLEHGLNSLPENVEVTYIYELLINIVVTNRLAEKSKGQLSPETQAFILETYRKQEIEKNPLFVALTAKKASVQTEFKVDFSVLRFKS